MNTLYKTIELLTELEFDVLNEALIEQAKIEKMQGNELREEILDKLQERLWEKK